MTRDLRLVGTSLLCWGIGEGLFFIFLPLYLAQLGADPGQIGTVLGLMTAAMALTLIPAGVLADHFGRRVLMIAGWATGIVACLGMFQARSLSMFIVAAVAYGFTGFVISPLNSYVISARGALTPGRALGLIGSMYHTGAIVGALAGGLIAERIGLRYVFLVASGLFVVSTALLFLTRHQPVEVTTGDHRYRPLLRNRPFGGLLLLAGLTIFALYLGTPLAPNFLQSVRGVPLAAMGAFGSVGELAIVISNQVLPRLGNRRGIVVAHVLVALGLLSWWRGNSVVLFALGFFFKGAFQTVRILVVAQADTLLERAQIGLAYGVVDTVGSLMLVVGAPIAGWLYEIDPSLPFRVGLVLTAVSLLAHLPGLRGEPVPEKMSAVPDPTSPDG